MEKRAEGAENSSAAAAPAAGASGSHWIWQVTALSVAMGVLLALALRTTGTLEDQGLSARLGVSPASLSQLREQSRRLRTEIKQLREKSQEFRTTGSDSQKAAKLLKEQIADYRAILGFAAVKGPGVKITLRNSPKVVPPGWDPRLVQTNDQDVKGLVSELWAAGAEAIAVAGSNTGKFERVVLSSVVLPAEGGIEVNGRVLSAPFEIQAIGNSKTLEAALEMPGGIIDNRELEFFQMIKIEKAQTLVLPEYSGIRRARGPAPANP
ncbi:MAG: DUF881 domain-containing protein [Armatimonadota bacterium]